MTTSIQHLAAALICMLSSTLATASPAEEALIREVLSAYTQSVTAGDQARFESLLLHPQIPFYGLSDGKAGPGLGSAGAVSQYARFRASVFGAGAGYRQRFYDVNIAHEGDLAQVDLRFETTNVATGGAGVGWKVLHLLKVDGAWKIASEFYTVRAK